MKQVAGIFKILNEMGVLDTELGKETFEAELNKKFDELEKSGLYTKKQLDIIKNKTYETIKILRKV